MSFMGDITLAAVKVLRNTNLVSVDVESVPLHFRYCYRLRADI